MCNTKWHKNVQYKTWNNLYDIDKRHPGTVVKRENPDYEHKKNNFFRNRQRSGLNKLDYLKLSIKKNIRNRLYLQF